MKVWRILLIEKDDEVAREATAALERAGYDVVRANDGLEGLKNMYIAFPDLIILDQELPIMEREEIYLRLIQASFVPIVILGSEEEVACALEVGADAYVVKPPDLSELVARVRTLLRRKSRRNPPRKSPRQEINGRLDNGMNYSNKITPTEFRPASCPLHNEGRLPDHPQLINEVWGGKMVSVDTLHF